jgi:hypothetical protein
MNAEDRFQAILRHPAYRNDPRLGLRRTFNLSGSAEEMRQFSKFWVATQYQAFLCAWGLTKAVEPDNKEEVDATLRDLRAGDTSIFMEQTTNSGHSYHFKADLERPLGDEAKRARKEMRAERKKRGITEKRTKPNMVDHWLVLDAMQIPGNSLASITRSLFDLSADVPVGSAACETSTRSLYLGVTRAYEKACGLIEEVGRHLPPGYTGLIDARAFRYRRPSNGQKKQARKVVRRGV